MESIIQVRDLVKRFGDLTAVDGISFDVKRGEIFGILGPNGAGKTTTLETLEGLQAPTSGIILVLGVYPAIPGTGQGGCRHPASGVCIF